MDMYWDGKGKYQAEYEKLNALIPSMGSVPNARTTNKKLEKLRKAANCYYDLFNNGLGNRAAEFRRVFGFGGKAIADVYHYRDCPLLRQLEESMDKIIEAAIAEQFSEV